MKNKNLYHCLDIHPPTAISATLEGSDISPVINSITPVTVTSDSLVRSIESKDVKEAQSLLLNSTTKKVQLPLVNSSTNEVKLIADGIEVAAGWMIEAGIDKKAIVAWKLKELGTQIPALEGVISFNLGIILR